MLNFCRLRWSRIGILNIAGGVIAAAPVLEQAAHAVPGTPAEQERLFQDFLKWSRKHKQ